MIKRYLALLSASLILTISSSTFVSEAMPIKASVYQTQKPMTTEMTFEGKDNIRRVLKISDQDVITLVAKEKNIKPEEVKLLDIQTLKDKAVVMTEQCLWLSGGSVATIKESDLIKYDIVKLDRVYLKNFKYIEFEGKKRLVAGYMSPIGYLSEDKDTQDLRPAMAQKINGTIQTRQFPEKYKELDKPSITGETRILSGTWYKVFITGVKDGDNFFISPGKADQIKVVKREGIVAGIRITK